MRDCLRASGAPVIAVSPLIGGNAVKGPTAKIMRELQRDASPLAVADHYRGVIDGFVLDECDAGLVGQFDIPVAITNTLMKSLADRERVATVALELVDRLRAGSVR
jgi:LPPG:FO 2-phospho-L-lactate transferase